MIEVPILQWGSKRFPCRRECQRGGIIAWLIIVFLLVSACLMVGGLFLAHSIKVHETRNDVQVETPFGSVHVQHNANGKAESTGIPMYPGAKPLHNGSSASIDLSELFGDKDLHIAAGKWQTPDPIDKVQKYYEDKFPDMSVVQHSNKVEMHSVNGHSKKIIALCDCGHGTEIALASVGEPRAN